MADINEAIARWMGWRRIGEMETVKEPGEAVPQWLLDSYVHLDEDGDYHARPIPRYTESLDAQMPVWEALGVSKIDLEVGLSGNKLAILFPPEGPWDDWFDAAGDSYAEASANAIHAALVAMGDIDA